MNNILSYIIIDILLLALSILLFLKYNNGKGGPLGSLKKRIIYSLSILSFIGFVVCVNKSVYCFPIKKTLNQELLNAYSELEIAINTNSTPSLHQEYLQPIITQYFIDNKSEIWLLFLIAHSKR